MPVCSWAKTLALFATSCIPHGAGNLRWLQVCNASTGNPIFATPLRHPPCFPAPTRSRKTAPTQNAASSRPAAVLRHAGKESRPKCMSWSEAVGFSASGFQKRMRMRQHVLSVLQGCSRPALSALSGSSRRKQEPQSPRFPKNVLRVPAQKSGV